MLSSPANQSANQPTNPTLTWVGASAATLYLVQVSPDVSFLDSAATRSLPVGGLYRSLSPPLLQPSTTYYWRVGSGNCLRVPNSLPVDNWSWNVWSWSPVWSFRTAP